MKQLALVVLTAFLAGSLFAQENETYIRTFKFSSGDNGEVTVSCTIEDGNCTVVVSKDGEVKKFTFPLESLEAADKYGGMFKMFDTDIDVMHPGKAFSPFKTTWLGVSVQRLSDQLRRYFKVRDSGGVLVNEVVEESPAEKAGLQAGDVILSIDREKVADTDDLVKIIREKDPEDRVKIRVIRDGKRQTFTATLESKTSREWGAMVMPHAPMMRHHGTDLDRDMMKSLRQELKELREELKELREEIRKP